MLPKSDDVNLIRRSALRMLTRRDYSQQELSLKLRTKGFSSQAIQSVINDLLQANLINEARFCENYIHWRRGKGYGPLRINMELQARGLASDLIAQHLEMTDNAWFIDARNVWQKQFKGRQANDYSGQAKQMRFMQYRGFTQEQIKSVLTELED